MKSWKPETLTAQPPSRKRGDIEQPLLLVRVSVPRMCLRPPDSGISVSTPTLCIPVVPKVTLKLLLLEELLGEPVVLSASSVPPAFAPRVT